MKNLCQHILLVAKGRNASAKRLADDIVAWLGTRNCRVSLMENTSNAQKLLQDFSHSDVDIVLILGGDGTMLSVARAFVQRPVPLTALNLGKVGFLAELKEQTWAQDLENLLKGAYSVVKRMALGWRIIRKGRIAYEGHAVNDVVVSRGALSRVITLDVSVDAESISRVRADGIIFSSPVGTTGYAVSAGGPLVHPSHKALLITAICPYLCNFPSMVLPPSMPVRVTLYQCSIETFATIDGQENYLLEAKDIVEVFCVPDAVHFARLKEDRYFTPLRERGFIQSLE